MAGCNSIINTLEKVEAVGIVVPKPNVPECSYVASGYVRSLQQLLPKAAPLAPGTTLRLKSNDSDISLYDAKRTRQGPCY